MKKKFVLYVITVIFSFGALLLIQKQHDDSIVKVDDLFSVGAQGFVMSDEEYIDLETIASIYGTTIENQTLTINSRSYIFDVEKNEILNEQGKVISTEIKEKKGKILVSENFVQSFLNLTITTQDNKVMINSKKVVPIIMYHTVDDNPNDTINTQPENFEDQIKALSEAGFTGITPHELHNYYFNQGDLPEKPIFITFDDGYKDNYTNAYPVLKKYNMKATIFVIASRIEHEGNNSYPNERPKITWEDAAEMSDLITIQNHTWDSHRKIDTQGGGQIGQIAGRQQNEDGSWETEEQYVARITDDLSKAQNVIAEKMGYDSVVISYPYGEANEKVFEVASSLGAELGVTVKKGVNYSYDRVMSLKRITVDGNYSGEQLVQLIEETK